MGDLRTRADLSNLSGLSMKVVRQKGPLLVPRLQSLVEFSWRREIYSGLLHGHHRNVDLKKCTTLKLSFNWGQNEDHMLGDNTSESSEKLLQRSNEEGQHMHNFGERRIEAIKHIFFQKFSASLMKFSVNHEDQSSPWRIFSIFLDMRRYKIGLIKIGPECIYLKTCPTSFSLSTRASFLFSTLNSF